MREGGRMECEGGNFVRARMVRYYGVAMVAMTKSHMTSLIHAITQ